MTTNTYFEDLYKRGCEYSKERKAREEEKDQIIETYGWDSEEHKAWKTRQESFKFPFTDGQMKAYRAWEFSRDNNLRIIALNPYILDIIQRRNEALENYEIQKELGTETDRQVKEAQIKYRLAENSLNKALEKLNLMEDEVASLNTVVLKRVEELESLQTTMEGLDKAIEDAQYRLAQKQKEISAVSGLLPQEEELSKQYSKTLSRLGKIENEIMIQNTLETPIKKALLPLNVINVHREKLFSIPKYIPYLLSGIVIIALSAPFFLHANTHGKRHVRPAPPPTKH